MSELKSQQQQEFHNGNNDPRLAGDSKLFDRTKDRKLYDLPRGITVQVFPNGELVDRAVSIVASNLTEVRQIICLIQTNKLSQCSFGLYRLGKKDGKIEAKDRVAYW